jgi:hypothetical protein
VVILSPVDVIFWDVKCPFVIFRDSKSPVGVAIILGLKSPVVVVFRDFIKYLHSRNITTPIGYLDSRNITTPIGDLDSRNITIPIGDLDSRNITTPTEDLDSRNITRSGNLESRQSVNNLIKSRNTTTTGDFKPRIIATPTGDLESRNITNGHLTSQNVVVIF